MTEPAEDHLISFNDLDKSGPFGTLSRWADANSSTYVGDDDLESADDVVTEFIAFFYRAVVQDFWTISEWETTLLNNHFHEVVTAHSRGDFAWAARAMTALFGVYRLLLADNIKLNADEKE